MLKEKLDLVDVGESERSGREPIDDVGDMGGGTGIARLAVTSLPPAAKREKSSDKLARSTEGVRACIVNFLIFMSVEYGLRG